MVPLSNLQVLLQEVKKPSFKLQSHPYIFFLSLFPLQPSTFPPPPSPLSSPNLKACDTICKVYIHFGCRTHTSHLIKCIWTPHSRKVQSTTKILH